jgi:dolichyl-phosphate beta-glucosyltransferase
MVANGPEREESGPTFSLIFPTYDAAAFIEQTWAKVARFLADTSDSWEILFVCDGCTDGTADRLDALIQGSGPTVRVVRYADNRGKGHAVRLGMIEAKGRYRVFTDVDLAYGFDDVVRLARALAEGAEVAIASRLHPESRLILPVGLHGYAYRRHLQSLVFSLLVRGILPLTQKDTQAGLKGLSAGAASRLLPELTCDGFGFDCELLLACRRQGLAIREVPVTMSYENRVSTTSWRTVRRMLSELWAIRRSAKSSPSGPTREVARRAA